MYVTNLKVCHELLKYVTNFSHMCHGLLIHVTNFSYICRGLLTCMPHESSHGRCACCISKDEKLHHRWGLLQFYLQGVCVRVCVCTCVGDTCMSLPRHKLITHSNIVCITHTCAHIPHTHRWPAILSPRCVCSRVCDTSRSLMGHIHATDSDVVCITRTRTHTPHTYH